MNLKLYLLGGFLAMCMLCIIIYGGALRIMFINDPQELVNIYKKYDNWESRYSDYKIRNAALEKILSSKVDQKILFEIAKAKDEWKIKTILGKMTPETLEKMIFNKEFSIETQVLAIEELASHDDYFSKLVSEVKKVKTKDWFMDILITALHLLKDLDLIENIKDVDIKIEFRFTSQRYKSKHGERYSKESGEHIRLSIKSPRIERSCSWGTGWVEESVRGRFQSANISLIKCFRPILIDADRDRLLKIVKEGGPGLAPPG